MAGITTFLDESKMPNRTQEQKVFDNLIAYVFQNFPKWGREVNDSLAAFNAALAGGAYALPYVFDTATADADPGAGKLRLSSATQNTSTTLRLDLTAGGQDYTTLIDTFDASTSLVKGSIRLVKQGDMSKWMTFDVTARSAPTGYRNLAVVCTDSSSASPFAKDDPLLLFFQRNGDKGEIGASGMVPLASAVITSPVASIDFLNLFSSLYDKYTIELQGITGIAGSSANFHLAFAGAVAEAGTYQITSGAGATTTANYIVAGPIGDSRGLACTIEVRNANSSGTVKGISARGFGAPNTGVLLEGANLKTGIASGFRIVSTSGSLIAGTIRIYGHRNN